MKKLFSAIARAFRAMSTATTTVWRYCSDTGKWIGETVASIGGGGASAPAAPATEELPVEFATAADLIPEDDGSVERLLKKSQNLLQQINSHMNLSPGDTYDRIGRMAKDVAEGKRPDGLDFGQLTTLQQDWFQTMPTAMVKLVADASRADLVRHIRGEKSIRGVIPCDKESVVDWTRSDEIAAARAAYEIETPAMDGDPEWSQGRLAAC